MKIRLGFIVAPLLIAEAITGCSSDTDAVATSFSGGASATGGHSGIPTQGGAGGQGGTPVVGVGGSMTGGVASTALDASVPQTDAGRPIFDGSCATLPGHVVYVESGDTQENLLKNLGRHLRDTANITLVYNLTGSCTLTNDIYTNAKIVPNGTMKYLPSTAEDPAWTASAAAPTCTTPAAGVNIDVAISALFVESCGLGDNGAPPAGSGLALIQGPVQAYTFIVPTASSQSAIWAEEAYYSFGFGKQNPLAAATTPWNDESFLFIRPASKSTLVATAKNIKVPPAKWKGVQESASSDVVHAVATSSNPEATIGILGSEVYDGKRGPTPGIKTLAFKAFGQQLAYYADSSATAFDKQNVRDGHYTLWSPTVYVTKVDAAKIPVKPEVKYLIDLVLGTPGAMPPTEGTPFDGLADVVKVGLIPECAMRVSRQEDGGDLSPYTAPAPCTCFYLSKIPGAVGAPAGCVTCVADAECGGGGKTCNHGFCEPAVLSTAGAPDGTCYSGTPSTQAQIINACSSSTGISKPVVLPSGGLTPLP